MNDSISTQRIEAFSDGVFSIAITLLVLEFQLPAARGAGGPSLLAELAQLWPAYVGYVMSFIMIGIYWANHHYIFQLYRSTNHVFNLLNIFFLMCISFLPFPAAVLSRRFDQAGDSQTAVLFYAFGLLLPAVGFTAMWLYASIGHRLVDRRLSEKFMRHLTQQLSGRLRHLHRSDVHNSLERTSRIDHLCGAHPIILATLPHTGICPRAGRKQRPCLTTITIESLWRTPVT